MKPTVSIGFCDFWPDFNARDNYFTKLLSTRYELQFPDDPDFLFFSYFGTSHRGRPGTHIYYTGENHRPNFRSCDYAFTFDYCDRPEHYRLPLYAMYGDVNAIVKTGADPQQILAGKTGFCNFVCSNPKGAMRNRFFEQLSKYKRIDSAGRWLNNVGRTVRDKLEFITPYKFTIAFENESHPGYTTEKIYEPMIVNSLPIYWGNPLVHLDFNPRSFVNYFDYGGIDELVDRVIELDRNDDLYCQHLAQPWYHNNTVNKFVDPANVLAQFDRIFAAPKPRQKHGRLMAYVLDVAARA